MTEEQAIIEIIDILNEHNEEISGFKGFIRDNGSYKVQLSNNNFVVIGWSFVQDGQKNNFKFNQQELDLMLDSFGSFNES